MRSLLTVLGLSATLIGGAAAIGDCDQGPWGEKTVVGAHVEEDHSIQICETRYKEGGIVTGIEMWADKTNFLGYQLSYSIGQMSHCIGSCEQKGGVTYKKLTWKPDSQWVTGISIWDNGKGDGKPGSRVGKVKITLNNGDSIEVGEDHPGSEVKARMYGGIILGAMGRANWAVHELGFMMLGSEIDRIAISDLKLDENALKGLGKDKISPETIDTIAKYNKDSDDYSFKWTRKYQNKKTQGFEGTTKVNFGFNYKLEISGQFEGVGPKVEMGWNIGVEKSTTSSWSEEKTDDVWWEDTVKIKKGYTLVCVGNFNKGTADNIPYTAKSTIYLKDGTSFDYQDKGHRDGVAYSKAYSTCEQKEGDHSTDGSSDPGQPRPSRRFIA